MAAPTLLTDRLVFMPLGPADLDEVAALLADPEVMRHVDGGVRTRAESADLLASTERNWKRNGWGLWAIREATTGGLVGEAGLQPVDDIDGVTTEFGFTLGRRHWGKGIATEAGRLLLDDAWERFDGDTIHAIVTVDNDASRSVLRKLGFREVSSQVIRGTKQELWAVRRTG